MDPDPTPPHPAEVYDDDTTIPDDEVLYRLIRVDNTRYNADGTVDRPGTNAFQDYPESKLTEVGAPAVAVSVFLRSALAGEGHVAALLDRYPGYGLAAIAAGAARAEGQGVVRWPTVSEPAHAMIFCKVGKRKSDGQSKRLAKAATVIEPPMRE